MPRDRNSEFEPQLVKKGQTRESYLRQLIASHETVSLEEIRSRADRICNYLNGEWADPQSKLRKWGDNIKEIKSPSGRYSFSSIARPENPFSMIRSSFLKAVAVIMLVLFSQPFLCNSVQGQKRRQRAAVADCKEGVKSDWRYEGLAAKNFSEPVDVGDGFQANRNCNTVDVTIPGAYSDSLSGSRAGPLSLQLAAVAFVKVCNTSAREPEDAMDNYFLKAKDVRQGSGDVVTEYVFRLNNGRVAHIFSYYNDLFGLMAIVKTSPAEVRK